MNRKRIYNPGSNENLTDRRVFNGNPHGILNFTKAKYQWALKLWDLMEANTWFPKEVDTSGDVRDYAYSLTQASELDMSKLFAVHVQTRASYCILRLSSFVTYTLASTRSFMAYTFGSP